MNKPDFCIASDYCGLKARGVSFYYGYEYSICAECGEKNNGEYCDTHEDADRYWCFVCNIDGQDEIVIPSNKLGISDQFNVIHALLTGIGWVFAKYQLVEQHKR